MLPRQSVSEVLIEGAKVGEALVSYLEEFDGKRHYYSFSSVVEKNGKQTVNLDLIRLFKLKVWSEKYRLSLTELFSILVPVCMRLKVMRHRQRLPVVLLTGSLAKKLLAKAIKSRYPHGENLLLWQEQERERQLLVERERDFEGVQLRDDTPKLLECESVEEFLTKYDRSIKKEKSALDKALTQTWRLKRYRNNPWIDAYSNSL